MREKFKHGAIDHEYQQRECAQSRPKKISKADCQDDRSDQKAVAQFPMFN